VMASGQSSEEARSRLQEKAEDVGLSETGGDNGFLDAEAAATSDTIGQTGPVQKTMRAPTTGNGRTTTGRLRTPW